MDVVAAVAATQLPGQNAKKKLQYKKQYPAKSDRIG